MTDHTPISDGRYTDTLTLTEKTGSAVVLTFGRMNPPTSGHQKLVDKLVSVAKQKSATPMIFLSHSQDKKKNPLSYDDKIRLAKKAFGNVVQKSNSRTIIEVLKSIQSEYDDVYVVVGSDRVKEFDTLLQKYNGKDYNFNSINVISAGERDPDADDVSGMSASKLRGLAVEGEYAQFRQGLPRKMSDKDAKDMYNKIREAMGITEDMSLDEVLNFQQRMKRKNMMRRIKGRIKLGKKRAKFRLASREKLKKRAGKKARELLRARVAGQMGKKYKELPLTARIQIDKKLENKKAVIQRIAKKLLPKVRKAEQERLKMVRSSKNESVSDMSQREYLSLVESILVKIEKEELTEKVRRNLEKKSEKYGLDVDELKEHFCRAKIRYVEDETPLNEEQWAFDSVNTMLANVQKCEIQEAIEYHIDNEIPFTENVFRMHSLNYYRLYTEARKLYEQGELQVDNAFDRELLETDIGTFGIYEDERVPLDCPMAELDEEENKDEDIALNQPRRGGPKKFFVYVKDPSTGNVKKVTFGDTTGLKAKINDPEARKSFAARHQCSTQNDRTKAAYWACRLPRYAKQLGLSGGGNYFW